MGKGYQIKFFKKEENLFLCVENYKERKNGKIRIRHLFSARIPLEE